MTAALPTTGRSLGRLVLVLVTMATMLTALQAAPASAYTVNSTGRYPGRVIGYQVQGSHYDVCPSNYYTCFNPWIVGTGPAVFRSPASNAAQRIAAVYQLQRWNGSSWVVQSQQFHTRVLYRGYSWLRMPRVDFLPTVAGHFRLVIGVSWSNYRDTVGYGARKLTYNYSGDYTCNTRFPCQVGNGWVWLRSPGV